MSSLELQKEVTVSGFESIMREYLDNLHCDTVAAQIRQTPLIRLEKTFQAEKRNRRRVKPDRAAPILAQLRVGRNGVVLHGQIRDLSMDGLGLTLFDNQALILPGSDTHAARISFALGSRMIMATGFIVRYEAGLIGLGYSFLSAFHSVTLARYLLGQIVPTGLP